MLRRTAEGGQAGRTLWVHGVSRVLQTERTVGWGLFIREFILGEGEDRVRAYILQSHGL